MIGDGEGPHRRAEALLLLQLVGALCDPEGVWQMTDEMPAAQQEWLRGSMPP